MRKAGEPESEAWLRSYHSDVGTERRTKAMPAKLQALGIELEPSPIDVLDLCCGNGEALETLYEAGYRNLLGVDMTPSPRLLEERRFAVRAGDACATELPPESQDLILVLHALHHMRDAKTVETLIDECWRVLRPGGRIAIVDFPNSPQIQLAFWFFRRQQFLFTPYLKYFGALIRDEWPFLKDYLPEFHKVWAVLTAKRFEIVLERHRLFYFYLTLRKPDGALAHAR